MQALLVRHQPCQWLHQGALVPFRLQVRNVPQQANVLIGCLGIHLAVCHHQRNHEEHGTVGTIDAMHLPRLMFLHQVVDHRQRRQELRRA